MSKYIIDFKNTVSEQDISDYLSQQNCTVLKVFQNFEKVVVVECDSVPVKTEIVDYIVNDDTSTLTLLGDEPITQQFAVAEEKNWWKVYSLKTVDFEKEQAVIEKHGENSIVYILDSGINENHPDFVGSKIEKLYSILDNTYTDNTGHGTCIASVICGQTCGITLATVKVCKIFDPNHQTLQSELLAAFDAVIQDYNNNRGKPAVVNLSWAIPKNLYIENKIKALIDKGLVIVAAAGNSGHPIDDVTPASMVEVLTIGSYNQDFLPSNFSDYTGTDSAISVTAAPTNHGALDGWAPGEKIWVATPDGQYAFVSGTSISAGITSAILAYNFDVALVDNQVIKCVDLQSLFHISALSLDRLGMLNLNDPKYSNSVNKVATIINAVVPFINSYEFRLGVKVGEIGCKWLFYSVAVKNIEILKPLAPGFRIENGWLVGQPTDPIEEQYKIFNGQIRLTFVDGTIKEVDVPTAIVHDTFDPNLYSSDEPIMLIMLTLNCPPLVPDPPPCWDGCDGGCAQPQWPPGYVCQCFDAKSSLCGCIM